MKGCLFLEYIIKEQDIATRFLFLGMAKSVIQLDLKSMQEGPFKIKEPYIDLLEKMYSVATNERRKLKKAMWDRKISVVTLEKDGIFSKYKLFYNGREELKTYHNNIIRRNVKEILEELMNRSLEGN
jgi:hypothetical protein